MRKFISFFVAIGIIFTIASCGSNNTSSSSSSSNNHSSSNSSSVVESLEVKQARLEENLSYAKNGFQFCITEFGEIHAFISHCRDYDAFSYLDDRIEKTNKINWYDEKYSDKIVAYAFLKDECSTQDLEEVKNIFNQLPELIVKDSVTDLYPYSDYSLAVTLHPYKVQDVLNNFSSIDENIESASYEQGGTNSYTGVYTEPRIVFELKEKSHGKVQELARKLIQREDLFYDVKLEKMPEYRNYFCSMEVISFESEPSLSKQTYLNDTLIIQAWENNTSLSTVKVGVIDSGIDATHEDLIGKVNTAMSMSLNGNTTSPTVDTYGHGTFVAGIIAANSNNNIGISGVAPNVELVSLKVDNTNHNTILQSITEAIIYATNNSIPILNISISVPSSDSPDQNVLAALNQAISNYPGLIVCAAGNSALDIDLETNYTYPACLDYENIIVVGAQNGAYIWRNGSNDQSQMSGSNFGNNAVDLFAPGFNILSTYSSNIDGNSKYAYNHGTSFAAPIVTGVAAMLKGKYPNISTSEIKYNLINNVSLNNNLTSYCVANGTVNAFNTLAYTHFHSLAYTQQANTHTESCACGYIKTEPHQLTYTYTSTNHTSSCNCGYTSTTSHTYNIYTYQDTTYHLSSCICGKSTVQKHTWTHIMAGGLSFDLITSPYYIPYYECRQCGAICMDPTTGI